MRKLLTDRTAIGLFFFLVLGGALYGALDFGLVARLMPLIVGIPIFVLSAIVLVLELAAQWRGKSGKTGGAMDGTRVRKDLSSHERRAMNRREGSTILWLMGLVALIWLIGLLWSIPVFLVLFFRLQGREPWRLSIAISLGTWAVVYLLFVLILKMELYEGLLPGLLGG